MKTRNDPVEHLAAVRSRRSFITLGVGAVAAYGGYRWLRSRPEVDGVEWPIQSVLRFNGKLAGAYVSDSRRVPEFSTSQVTASRLNGDVGLGNDFDPEKWILTVQGPGLPPRNVTMAEIRALPPVDQVTQLNCIEGWTIVVHWVGARFADFTAKYAPEFQSAKYVGMETPDGEYYVGLDAASAFHPQTLLSYEMNGTPLTSQHGAPLRLVIPVKYGIKNIKRIGKIIYTDKRPKDYWAEDGYDWFAGL